MNSSFETKVIDGGKKDSKQELFNLALKGLIKDILDSEIGFVAVVDSISLSF